MTAKKLSVIGLALLGLATAVMVVLAFLHVRPATVSAQPQPSVPGSPTTTKEEPTPSASQSATPQSSPSATPGARTPEAIKALLAREPDLQIVVLGDDTGAGQNGWVAQWAASLGKNAQVRLENGQADAQVIGSGNRKMTVRNVTGLTLKDATAQMEKLVPADTDLVLLSFGHRENQASFVGDLKSLWAKVPPGAGAAVIVQNPSRGTTQQTQRDKAKAETDWAAGAQAATVNVADAFLAAPEPLVELVGPDGVVPSEAGAKVWREAVVKQLG